MQTLKMEAKSRVLVVFNKLRKIFNLFSAMWYNIAENKNEKRHFRELCVLLLKGINIILR